MLKVENITKSYRKSKGFWNSERFSVLKNISFTIRSGEKIGLVGESGSGKSTLSRILLGLEKPDSGQVTFEGTPTHQLLQKKKGVMNIVFQNYHTSVNPNYSVEKIIAEPFLQYFLTRSIRQQIDALMDQVELPDRLKSCYPHELSGGQLQRVCIARAIAVNPRFLILDEAVSALDVSNQLQILNLLSRLQASRNLTYLFISHNLESVLYLCDVVYFLQEGTLVERSLCSQAHLVQTAYARQLFASVLPFDTAFQKMSGQPVAQSSSFLSQ